MPTLLFWKPYRVLTHFTDANSDGDGRLTLADFIDVPDVYAAGRLDYDSEGLLLLTDDGDLNHRLTHPKYGHPRTYWAQVEGIPDEAALDRIRRGGLEIKTYRTRPAQVKRIAPPDVPPRDPPIRYRANIPDCWLELTLTEGKKRQVRRMTAAIGHPTLRLVRAAMGSLTLAGLTVGQWRIVTDDELRELHQSLR